MREGDFLRKGTENHEFIWVKRRGGPASTSLGDRRKIRKRVNYAFEREESRDETREKMAARAENKKNKQSLMKL